MTQALTHWLEALDRVEGPQASIGLNIDSIDRWPESSSDWPAQYCERVIIRLQSLDADAMTCLGLLRNQYARQIAVWVDQPKASDLNQMLGLGFKELAAPPGTGCYGYDIVSYNHTRDWNNPKYWANPERWGLDHW